jgi:two-component system sensor histidine kinase UhpB
MSLRFRLNLLITTLFLLILLGGSFYVIINVRQAVHNEVEATAHLALQLIEIAISSVETEQETVQERLLEQIAKLERTRHLRIYIRIPSIVYGDVYSPSVTYNYLEPVKEMPISSDSPDWFEHLVQPPPLEIRRWLYGPGIPATEILIRADPSDEITEAWIETRGVIGFLLVFLLLANVLVFISIGRDLAPIERILSALDSIEQGNYQLRLPRFKLPELSRISEKFNLMAEVLQRSRDENRFLTQSSLAIQENERRHLAHELHDELGQTISAIKAVAVSIGQQSDMGKESITASAGTIVSFSNHMHDVARNMMRRLRPAALDELGLITALEDMVDDWNSRNDEVFCHFSFDSRSENTNEDLNISLYRIVQETLTNVHKHSGASEVYIHLTFEGSDVELTIRDNGCGFDPATTQWGLGLLGIRERVQALQGTFSLNTSVGQGLSIRVVVPLL